MTDIIDRAKEVEMLNRETALQNQQQRASQHEEPRIVNGRRCCIDCDEPIPSERLEASPYAVRCVWCQEDFELAQRRKVDA